MPFATALDRIENRTFSELKVGDSASITRALPYRDIELFAIMSGDVNPAHVDEQANDLMVELEAMKMETNVTAPIAGKLRSVNVSPRDSVKSNQILVEFG